MKRMRYLVVARTTSISLAGISAEEFVERVLAQRLSDWQFRLLLRDHQRQAKRLLELQQILRAS